MTQSGSYDVNAIRREFPILKKSINGYPLVYLDSAASAKKPLSVIEAHTRCDQQSRYATR